MLVGGADANAYELLFSFASSEGKEQVLHLVRTNQDMGNDYIEDDYMSPTAEEIGNARPIGTIPVRKPNSVLANAGPSSRTAKAILQPWPPRLAAEALFLGRWGSGDVVEFALPSRAPVGGDRARDGILQIARFPFCLIDLIAGQGGIEIA